VTNLLSQRNMTAAALAVVMCFSLAACGDDEGDGKTVANTPTGNQTKLPDPPNLVAQRDASKDKGNDVLDWLKMSPEKTDKDRAADKKAAADQAKAEQAKADQAKADQAKADQAKAEAKIEAQPPRPTPSSAPVQVASASQPVLQPVSASAREAALPPPVASAPVQVASAAPVQPQAVPSAASQLKLVSREQPGFPPEAVRKGVTSGHVRARISVGVDGSVTNVEVLQSSPPRIFDNAVVAAAKRWKYAPMAEPASTVTEFDFKGGDE
jgi:protein TonB